MFQTADLKIGKMNFCLNPYKLGQARASKGYLIRRSRQTIIQDHFGRGCELSHLVVGDEDAFPSACEHHDTDRVIAFDLVEKRPQLHDAHRRKRVGRRVGDRAGQYPRVGTGATRDLEVLSAHEFVPSGCRDRFDSAARIPCPNRFLRSPGERGRAAILSERRASTLLVGSAGAASPTCVPSSRSVHSNARCR